MRKFLGWLVGIIVMVAIGIGFTAVGAALGVPSSIDLDEPTNVTHGGGRYSYDEEVTSLQTTYGYVSGALSVVVALWAGQAAYHFKLGAGFTRKGWYSYFAWLIALAALVVLSVVFHLAFRQFHGALADYARMFIELASIAGVAWAAHQWYKNRVAFLGSKGEA
jgi:hypothetical protein